MFCRKVLFYKFNSAPLVKCYLRCFGTRLTPITSIGFIGLGAMGNRMSKNLIKQFNDLHVFDVSKSAMTELEMEGANVVSRVSDLRTLDCVISMLPTNQAVLDVYSGQDGLLRQMGAGTILVDCSTVDPQIPQRLAEEAGKRDIFFLDAPVSGGVMGAAKGSLMFMVGGSAEGLQRCREVLLTMGQHVVHCGPSGMGQAAKICNNMMMAVSMVAASETLNLGVRLGLCPKLLSNVINYSSGRCWSIDTYNPVPGVMPETPSSNDYKAGFKSCLMLKDLILAKDVAKRCETAIPFGSDTLNIYKTLCDQQKGDLDFSAVYRYISELKTSS